MFELSRYARYLSFMPSFCFAPSGLILVAGGGITPLQLCYDHQPWRVFNALVDRGVLSCQICPLGNALNSFNSNPQCSIVI